jgi:hypothetical protein
MIPYFLSFLRLLAGVSVHDFEARWGVRAIARPMKRFA